MVTYTWDDDNNMSIYLINYSLQAHDIRNANLQFYFILVILKSYLNILFICFVCYYLTKLMCNDSTDKLKIEGIGGSRKY